MKAMALEPLDRNSDELQISQAGASHSHLVKFQPMAFLVRLLPAGLESARDLSVMKADATFEEW
jgi:hypothetical protein